MSLRVFNWIVSVQLCRSGQGSRSNSFTYMRAEPFMRSESAKARLSDDLVPVHHDVDSHVHERGEIRACESVKVGGRDFRNPVAPEDCMIEKQTALWDDVVASNG